MSEPQARPERTCVFGCSGSGKSTLGRKISDTLGVAHLELDSIYHGPNWEPYPAEMFLSKIAEFVARERWVVDGNYRIARPLTIPRADTVVFLDYSFPLTFSRSFRRTTRRCLTREELWNGNRESLYTSFLTRDSILWWVITSWSRMHRWAIEAPSQDQFRGKTIHRFRHPRDCAKWLDELCVVQEEPELASSTRCATAGERSRAGSS